MSPSSRSDEDANKSMGRLLFLPVAPLVNSIGRDVDSVAVADRCSGCVSPNMVLTKTAPRDFKVVEPYFAGELGLGLGLGLGLEGAAACSM